jgi:hypothetical protein
LNERSQPFFDKPSNKTMERRVEKDLFKLLQQSDSEEDEIAAPLNK